MINIFEIGINLLENIIVITFLSLYFGFKRDNYKKYIWWTIGIVAATILISSLNKAFKYEGALGLTMAGAYFLYSFVFLKGDWQTKLLIPFCIDCALCVISLISMFTTSQLFQCDFSRILDFSYERVINIIISKILLAALCWIVLRKFKVKNLLSFKYVVSQIVLTFLAECSVIQINNIMIKSNALNKEMIIISLGIIAMLVLAYCIFVKQNYNEQMRIDYFQLKQSYESDKQHIKDVKELYEKTCEVRGKLEEYFENALSYLNTDANKAKEYMETIIKTEIGKNFVQTGNDCFDAIVNAKISMCENRKIYVQINVAENSLDKLTTDEIGIIFGNLFDNAITASENSKEKTIELDVGIKGEYLSIVMMNSVDVSVLKNNKTLQTTKSDKTVHGFGTKNIQKIVDEHNGIVNYFEENGYFGCQILI